MMVAAGDSTATRALSAEILASEQLRARVLVIILATLMVVQFVVMIVLHEELAHLAHRPLSPVLPFYGFGPFLLYECIVIFVIRRFAAHRRDPPVIARFVNAIIETSLPTVILYIAHNYLSPAAAFGAWPSLLYFVFIAAATLRLNFALPMFTGLVAAVEYLGIAFYLLPLSPHADEPVLTPLYHTSKAVIMLVTGIVAGLVAQRLRRQFFRTMEETASRERVTNLFGQHVSPAVVTRLLDLRSSDTGEVRDVCIMFLDIGDFTAQARTRQPPEVVAYLNEAFAFMIESVDRHHGIINKFLGDGFMAVFGAPLDDPLAARHAVDAAREILAEIDRRGRVVQAQGGAWPLQVRIGVHAGAAVTGNVGSPQRKEFTVIGDVVNLAARLEQLNKAYGSRLLVSDAVIAALGGVGAGTALDVTVKSYADPIRVWRLDP